MTTQANPYESPQAKAVGIASSQPSGKLSTLPKFGVWLLVYLYPVWLLGSFHLTWLVAWGQLGHRPRPSLDDPSSISGLVDIVYYGGGMLVMLMPLLGLLGLASSFFCPLAPQSRSRWVIASVLACSYVALFASSIYLLRSDPWQVVEWWFD